MTTSNRLIKIYQHLVEHEDWITAQELAVLLNCSVKTVRKDIVELTSFLPENWLIETQRGKGVFLHRPPNQTNLAFEHLINETDKLHNLITFLIRNESGCSLSEVSQALYYSASTISKVLELLRKDLKKYYLKIDMRPIRINGEEFHLRQFYFDFYLRKHCFHMVSEQFSESIYSFISEIERKGGFTFSDHGYAQLPILLSIWQSRMIKKEYITEFIYPAVLVESGNSIDWLLTLIKNYLESIHVMFIPSELHYGAALILGAARVEKKKDDDCLSMNQIIGKPQLDSIMNVINYVEKQTQLPFSKDPILVQQCHEYFEHAKIRLITKVYSYANPHKSIIKNKQAFLYNCIQEAIVRNCNYAESFRDDDFADITMYFMASKKGQEMQQKEKTILLYMNDLGVMRYMKLKLLDNINGHIRLMTTNQVHEMVSLALHGDLDAIITTNHHIYGLVTNDIPVLQVSPLLSDSEVKMIKNNLKL